MGDTTTAGQPAFWGTSHPNAGKLHLTRVEHTATACEHRVLVLVTAQPIPVIIVPIKKRLRLGRGDIAGGSEFTKRILRAIVNKAICAQDPLPYIVLPLLREASPSSTRIRYDDIDWEAVTGSSHIPQTLDLNLLEQDIDDTMVTRLGAPEFSHRSYVRALSQRAEPMLELSKAPTAASYLYPAHGPSKSSEIEHVPVAICQRYGIHASIYRSALVLPSIFTILGDYLIAAELNERQFSGSLPVDQLVQALCAPAAQRPANYQRLEFLGDILLKFMASTTMFITHPSANEHALNAARAKVVNNKALETNMNDTELGKYIRQTPLRLKQWVPVGFASAGQKSEALNVLAPKTLSDVAEAIIGAAYLANSAVADAYDTAKRIGVGLPLGSWSDVRLKIPETPIRHLTNGTSPRALGYTFVDATLYRTALSLGAETVSHRQRLEFLGDSLLDYLTATHIYNVCPAADEGDLSMFKSASVNNDTLAAFCVKQFLHREIVGITQETHRNQIRQYEIKLGEARRGTASQPYWKGVPGPKSLADTVESVLGAIFVDASFELEPVKKVFDQTILPFLIAAEIFERSADRPQKRRKLGP